MNCLITGGTGLIGKALIGRLTKNKANITVLTRNKSRAKQILGSGISFLEELSISEIEKQEVIINLAGEPIAEKRWSTAQKNEICQSRWQITHQLAELIKQAKNPPHLFISGSAIGIYGRQSNAPINEEYQQYFEEFTHQVCQTWEENALSSQSINTRIVLLRTGIVLAHDGGALKKLLLPFKLGLGGKIASGKQIMSWIHLQDMIDAILFIISNETMTGAVNLTAPNPVSNKVFSQTLAKRLNRPSLLTTPSWLLTLVLGEMADLMLYGQNVIPKKLCDAGFTYKFPELAAALEDLIP